MISDSLKKEILNIIFSYISKEQCMVFLFGSFARGEERKTSDIDVGIVCDEIVPYNIRAALKEDLDEKIRTLRKIELVDFLDIKDKIFVKEALKEVEIWYQGKDCKITLESLRMHSVN